MVILKRHFFGKVIKGKGTAVRVIHPAVVYSAGGDLLRNTVHGFFSWVEAMELQQEGHHGHMVLI